MIDYPAVITYLRPNAEWVMNGNGLDGLEWIDDSAKPTEQECVAAWPEFQQAAADEAAAREAAKASALAKLEALGLTADEAQAIAGI
jgi:hypothetical protein